MPHRFATSPSLADAQAAAVGRDDARISQTLIDELEDAITKQNLRQRATVMRRVTDLFIVNSTGFSEEHIAMFDDVMSRLVVAIDTSARAEFGSLLARHGNAPLQTTRILARSASDPQSASTSGPSAARTAADSRSLRTALMSISMAGPANYQAWPNLPASEFQDPRAWL